MNIELALVIPAYNEEACIEAVVKEWLTIFKEIPGRLLIVDDGSTDQTAEILKGLSASHLDLIVIHQKNSGHGAAVMRGYREALGLGANYVFQTDSDAQFRVDDFWTLWKRRAEADFLVGVRAQRKDPLQRRFISRLMRGLVGVFFGVSLRDPNSPFRLMKGAALQKLWDQLPLDVFAPNIFLSILAKRNLPTLLEIPVTHQERKTGRGSLFRWKLVRVCARCVRELLAFRWSLTSFSDDLHNASI